jgi:hypothetical protein
MNSSAILPLLISLLLAFVSTWSLATFIKLKKAPTSNAMSITEIHTGFWVSVTTLALSILLIAFSSVLVYK